MRCTGRCADYAGVSYLPVLYSWLIFSTLLCYLLFLIRNLHYPRQVTDGPHDMRGNLVSYWWCLHYTVLPIAMLMNYFSLIRKDGWFYWRSWKNARSHSKIDCPRKNNAWASTSHKQIFHIYNDLVPLVPLRTSAVYIDCWVELEL